MSAAATTPSTTRFSVVVAQCGRPAVHLTLLAPAKDDALQKLERQNRIMAIQQTGRDGGADHGSVGIRTGPGTQLLVFPRSLRRFAGHRIVGVNYNLLDEALHATAASAAVAKTRPAPKPRPAQALPAEAAAPVASDLPPPPPPKSAPPAELPREPLTMRDVQREVRAIERLLKRKRTSDAREKLRQLGRNIDSDLIRSPRPSS